jgi:hypothetical protein
MLGWGTANIKTNATNNRHGSETDLRVLADIETSSQRVEPGTEDSVIVFAAIRRAGYL